jgi:hypothetical protein
MLEATFLSQQGTDVVVEAAIRRTSVVLATYKVKIENGE